MIDETLNEALGDIDQVKTKSCSSNTIVIYSNLLSLLGIRLLLYYSYIIPFIIYIIILSIFKKGKRFKNKYIDMKNIMANLSHKKEN